MTATLIETLNNDVFISSLRRMFVFGLQNDTLTVVKIEQNTTRTSVETVGVSYCAHAHMTCAAPP